MILLKTGFYHSRNIQSLIIHASLVSNFAKRRKWTLEYKTSLKSSSKEAAIRPALTALASTSDRCEAPRVVTKVVG